MRRVDRRPTFPEWAGGETWLYKVELPIESRKQAVGAIPRLVLRRGSTPGRFAF